MVDIGRQVCRYVEVFLEPQRIDKDGYIMKVSIPTRSINILSERIITAHWGVSIAVLFQIKNQVIDNHECF